MPNTSHSPGPKYSQVAERFLQRIQKGQLKPGDRLPTYAEMKEQHAVSRPTMDKALDLLDAQGAIERRRGQGVFVAPKRAPQKRGVIGFLGLSSEAQHHPYGARIFEGVSEVADREEMEILVLGRSSSIEWEKVDGVLSCNFQAEDELHRLPPGMPYVRLFMPSTQASSVVVDDERGALEATKYLLSLGHRRIAYLTSTLEHRISRQRLGGYHKALEAANIQPDPRWVREIVFYNSKFGTGYVEQGQNMIHQWLGDNWRELGCTALLTANDETAIGALKALREAGISVPDELSVIGFDGTELSQYATPSLTSVQVPLREMSALGTELLLRQVQQRLEAPRPQIESLTLQPRLVLRESTAPPAVS